MANHLRERRKAAGLTQQRLADLASCSRSTLKLLEAGYAPSRSAARDRVELVLRRLRIDEPARRSR